MIQRIVKLNFHEDRVADFIKVYRKHLANMKENEHCISLELLSEKSSHGSFFTYSVWHSEESLEKYRASDYFKEIWSTIKPWFGEKPKAWTLEKQELA